MISLLLAGWLAAPSYNTKADLSHGQVRRKAHQIVQLLRQQDPRVLRSVMYYMGWVPKMKYTRENCKKKIIKTREDPVLDILLDIGGFPTAGPRKRK